jgi:hypothetical protein
VAEGGERGELVATFNADRRFGVRDRAPLVCTV